MYVQQCLRPGCTDLAMQGRERNVQLLHLLLVASAGTWNMQHSIVYVSVACLWHGLGVAAFVSNWIGSRHLSVKVGAKQWLYWRKVKVHLTPNSILTVVTSGLWKSTVILIQDNNLVVYRSPIPCLCSVFRRAIIKFWYIVLNYRKMMKFIVYVSYLFSVIPVMSAFPVFRISVSHKG